MKVVLNGYQEPWDHLESNLPKLREVYAVAKKVIDYLAESFPECSSLRLEMQRRLVIEVSRSDYHRHSGAFDLEVLYSKPGGRGCLSKVRAWHGFSGWEIRACRADGPWVSTERGNLGGDEVPQVVVTMVAELDRKGAVLTEVKALLRENE